ncbi:MAG TPA: hypothetical protein DEA55_08465 [Rhodospirillaceae bacterium]|nr:hypothetical protein [Rhodospirillaceae bacterium]
MTTITHNEATSEKMEPGQFIPGKGIYLGLWTPRDSDGETLHKTFNVFAAPTDILNNDTWHLTTEARLKGIAGFLGYSSHKCGHLQMTFKNAVKFVANLRDYYGHDGGHFTDEEDILDAVRNNPDALQKWFIPTVELMIGKTVTATDRKTYSKVKIQFANLVDSRFTGDFRGTFMTSVQGLDFNDDDVCQYWTVSRSPDESDVFAAYLAPGDGEWVNYSVGGGCWAKKNRFKRSTRVVRAELVPDPYDPVFDPSQPDVGKLIQGKGINLGTWEPKGKDGRTLGKIFDLYAAPEDIRNNSGPVLMNLNNAVKHVADLKNYHGHDGGNFANDNAILEAAINDPKALAKWFIPTKEILHGKTSGGDKIQTKNLYDYRNIGDFKNTFIAKNGSRPAGWYCSLTEIPDYPSLYYSVPFVYGSDACMERKDDAERNTRVVRAELRME